MRSSGTDASNDLSYLFLHAYDRMRLRDCKAELQALLQQEVRGPAAPGLPR